MKCVASQIMTMKICFRSVCSGNYAFGDAARDYRRRKKQMERDITRSMFSIRVTEMKSAWLQNR